MESKFFSNVQAARKFESEIEDTIDRAFVQWAINRAMLRPSVEGDVPSVVFDVLFFAKVMQDLSSKRRVAQIIFEGRSSELW
jgi:hypothetical protein